MIIRTLRKNERAKLDAIYGCCYGYSVDLTASAAKELSEPDSEFFGAYKDDGETLMAIVAAKQFTSMFHGRELSTLGIAGVATMPQYRRQGLIRKLLAHIFELAPQKGWVVSYLYPFSFRYYRKFGYELAFVRKTITIPFTALKNIPRFDDVKLYNSPELLPDLLSVYNSYARGLNCMFLHKDGRYFSDNPGKTQDYCFIGYTNGKPTSFVLVRPDGNSLKVGDIGWLDKASLLEILGFLRSYEGQYQKLSFKMLPAGSPLEYLLDLDRDCDISRYFGAMGRFTDFEFALSVYPYSKPCDFTVAVENDFIQSNNGVYRVVFDGVSATVSRGGKDADLTIESPALSRLLLGECGGEALPALAEKLSKPELCELFKATPGNIYDSF